MGIGKLLRSQSYTVTDSVSGATATYTVRDGIGPDWASFDGYRGGMTIPGAWRAANLLADLIGAMPWDAYRSYGGAPLQCIEPTPPLLDQPNPPDTRYTTFSSMMLDKLWHGNAVAIIAARNAQGWPTAAIPVPAYAVSVRRVTPYIDSPLPIGELEYSIGEMFFGSADLIHIKGPCRPGSVRGMGVLEAHFETLNLAKDQQRQAQSISKNGVPTGVLESSNPDLTDAEAAKLKAAWLASQSSRTVAVTNATTKFTPLSWNPDEMQMIEARKFTLNELELCFGLPVGWLGGGAAGRVEQYSNIEQDAVNLLKFTLNGHLAAFEQTLSLAFPRGTVVKANLNSVLRSDTLTRYQAHEIALGMKTGRPFMTVDEVRDIENLPPEPSLSTPPTPPTPIQAQATVDSTAIEPNDPAAMDDTDPMAIAAP